MKSNNSTSPPTTALCNSIAEMISRFLDGLTSPAEEQQLRSALEAQEAQGAILNDDERAVLALLCLSFPEEDTKALLTEERSIEYESLTAASRQASARYVGSGHQSRGSNALALHGHIRRIAATVAAVAAVLALVLMTVIGKRNREDVLTAQAGQFSSRTNHASSALDERAAPPSALQAPSPAYSPPTVPVSEGAVAFENGRKQPSKHSTPSLTGRAVGGSVGAVSAENKPMTPSLPQEDAVTSDYEDPDGAAILAAEQQRILEVEQAARQRAIAVTQENTLACVTAASPS